MRKVITVALCLAIQGAALSAPFVHAHPDDHDTGHHAGPTVHTHWAAHGPSHTPSHGPAVDADEHDRAISVGAFVALTTSGAPSLAIAHASYQLAVPPERSSQRPVHVAHGHDPPFARLLSARAPPAHPVLI